MSRSPVITHVLFAKGLALDTIFVGLVVNDERIAWGGCVPAASDKQREVYPDFDAGIAQEAIRKLVVPILVGQPLKEFKGLMARIDSATETAVITRRRPKPAKPPGDVSRRDLITGRLWAAGPDTEQLKLERPLHPAIRYGVSQALTSALAREQGVTLTELIVSEYNLPWSPLPVPFHLELDDDETIPDASLLSPEIRSLGTRIAADTPNAQLGASGERLQRFVRQMAAVIGRTAEDNEPPTLQLDVAGNLGRLFDNDAGRILGALYGLEQAAKPCRLRVVDPVLSDDRQARIELMSQIRDYARMRGMSVQLAARAGIESVTDVKALVRAEAAHLLTLSLLCLGSIDQVIEAVLTCRRAETAVLLEGPAETAVHVALATQVELVAASAEPHGHWSLSAVHDEMARTLAWLAAKPDHDE